MENIQCAISTFDSRLFEFGFKKRKLWFWFCIAILLIWRGIIILYLPYASIDGHWSLSQTFSLMRGDLLSAPLGFSYIDPYIFPYFYAVLTAPAFALLPFGIYNIFIWNLLLALILIILIFSLVNSESNFSLSSAFILIIGILGSTYTYGLRPELLITVLMMLLLKLLIRPPKQISNSIHGVVIGVLTTVIGLTHPVAGIFSVVFVSLVLYDQKAPFRYVMVIGFTIIVSLSILYLPVILIDVKKWWHFMFNVGIEQDTHTFSGTLFFKYALFSPIVFFPPLITLINVWRNSNTKLVFWIREIFYWSLIIGIISIFGRSYYFPYLIIFITWRLTRLPRIKVPALALLLIFLIAPYLTHYAPTIQLIENPQYSQTLRQIISEIETYGPKAESDLVWVNSNVVMPIAERPGTRIFFNFFRTVAYKGMEFSGEDIFLYIHPRDYRTIVKNLDISEDNFIVTELIPAIPGLLRPGSFFRERGPSLGLWKISLIDP